MKLVKKACGKTNVKISQKEWKSIGKKAGWLKEAQGSDELVRYNQQSRVREDLTTRLRHFVESYSYCEDPMRAENFVSYSGKEINTTAISIFVKFANGILEGNYHGLLFAPDSAAEFRPINYPAFGSVSALGEEILNMARQSDGEPTDEIMQKIKEFSQAMSEMIKVSRETYYNLSKPINYWDGWDS